MTSAAPRCRDAAAADAAALGAIHVAAWRAAYAGHMPAEFLARLDAARAARHWVDWLRAGDPTIVVESGAAVVGFCRYGPSRDPGSMGVGEIIAINLDPAHWRRGFGRVLLLEACARLHAAGCNEATLWVLDQNDGARRFYEAHDWRLDGARRVDTALTGAALQEVRYRIALSEGAGPGGRGRGPGRP